LNIAKRKKALKNQKEKRGDNKSVDLNEYRRELFLHVIILSSANQYEGRLTYFSGTRQSLHRYVSIGAYVITRNLI